MEVLKTRFWTNERICHIHYWELLYKYKVSLVRILTGLLRDWINCIKAMLTKNKCLRPTPVTASSSAPARQKSQLYRNCIVHQVPDFCVSEYAGKDSTNCRVSKSKFLSFLETKLAVFTKSQKDPGVLDHIMQKQDLHCNGQLDF